MIIPTNLALCSQALQPRQTWLSRLSTHRGNASRRVQENPKTVPFPSPSEFLEQRSLYPVQRPAVDLWPAAPGAKCKILCPFSRTAPNIHEMPTNASVLEDYTDALRWSGVATERGFVESWVVVTVSP